MIKLYIYLYFEIFNAGYEFIICWFNVKREIFDFDFFMMVIIIFNVHWVPGSMVRVLHT